MFGSGKKSADQEQGSCGALKKSIPHRAGVRFPLSVPNDRHFPVIRLSERRFHKFSRIIDDKINKKRNGKLTVHVSFPLYNQILQK